MPESEGLHQKYKKINVYFNQTPLTERGIQGIHKIRDIG